MNQNKLFNQTRLKLALSYALVMGLILCALGSGVYSAIAHAHWMVLDQELETVGETLRDRVTLQVNNSTVLNSKINELLPNFCLVGFKCQENYQDSAIARYRYYIRIYNRDGNLVGRGGAYPQGLPETFNPQLWQTQLDAEGNIYHQVSLKLQKEGEENWGYFQVGRSTKDFQDYLSIVKLSLKLGLPISLILVALSSWWLAGLAMQPIYLSYRQIQQFTADAAHELRTPLAATQATVESGFLASDLNSTEVKNILSTVLRQNRRLSELVNDLLLLARMDRQVLPALDEVCCLNDLVIDLVEEYTPLAKSHGVILMEFIKISESIKVKGSEDQLYRLVSNLIVNGLQYTQPGGKVIVILDRIPGYGVIRVKDSGIGIAASQQKRIFDRFYRVESARGRINGGSGLGLAIAMAITQAHKGKLYVESEINRGSIFSVELPHI